ncbi:hypothetical protein CGMCC3_g14799 [Colletotrichum fructicola]|nr:uncharacterized protein CGMCC3_g14799 [Colletotrichum fructicola]KAE9569074.1 hypothetical protein CGMCC3_g14799 [Colletotrichum fructicola]
MLLYRTATLLWVLNALAPGVSASPQKPCPIDKRSAQEVVQKLGLIPNEEKGYYTQTFQDPDTDSGNRSPHYVIAKNQWQRATSHGRWTLVGTTVAPGFVPNGIELADPDWMPNGA